MAYATKILEPSQDPIVLFEVDFPLENELWINESAGLWKKNLTPGTVTVTGSDAQIGYYGIQNTIIYFIQSMRVNNIHFAKMSSWANMAAQNKSFYYDQATTTIHAHFDNFNPPYVYENIILGATQGYCNRVDPANDGLYDNVVYDPRIISVPDVSRKKDFLFYGLLQYAGGTVVLDNVDGGLDSFKDANIMSQASRVLAGFAGDEYADFKRFDGFFIDDYSFNFDEFRFEIVDIRKRLSRTLPVAQFDATTYPDIDPKNVGENIPMPLGQVYDAPVICTNDEEGAPATYTFVFAYVGLDDLTQYGVKAGQTLTVRVDGEDSLDVVTLDAAAGTFTLKVLNGDRGDDWVEGDYNPAKHKGKVTVDGLGYVDIGNNTIENNLDVLKLVVSEFLGIAYIADNYNTVEWAAEAAGVFDIGKFINKDLEVSELIEEVCTTEDGVYLIQDDGKITFKTSDTSKAISLTIYADEYESDPEIDPRTNEYLSSVTIAYSEQVKEKRFLKKANTTYEQEVLNNYGRYKKRTIKTLLTSSADATAKAEAVMLSSKTIPIIVSIETGLQTSELEIFDTINAEIDRPDKSLFGMSKWEVLGVNKRLMDGTVDLILKYVEAA